MFAMGPLLLAGVPVSAGAAVTWNPSDTNANIALSGGNLVATRGAAASNYYATRATTSRSAGKRCYININTTATANDDGLQTGLMLGTDSLSNFPGASATGYSVHSINGRAYNNNAQVGTDIGMIVQGDGAAIAVDFSAGKIWIGRYFASTGTVTWSGDPAAGTGQRFTFTPGTALFPACAQYRQPQVSTANFKPSTIISLPAGFVNW